jgi:hypothetical protein
MRPDADAAGRRQAIVATSSPSRWSARTVELLHDATINAWVRKGMSSVESKAVYQGGRRLP